MHITLTGNLGSGKSTICKLLEQKFGYEIFSTGKVQRKLAQELGISVLEMNQLMCSDHKYDTMIDDTTARISRENPDKNIVFDSRLAWNFVEKSFKVFLSVQLDVAAERVFSDQRGDVESYQSIEETKQKLKLRAQTEDMRYKEIYHLDYFNFSNYNLVLDSTYCTPELLTNVILQEAKNHSEDYRILMSVNRFKKQETPANYSTQGPYYLNELVTVHSNGEQYTVVEGQSILEEAVKKNLPFVLVKII